VYLSINEQRCQYKNAFRDRSWHIATAVVRVVVCAFVVEGLDRG
jgi:hypothetical protein